VTAGQWAVIAWHRLPGDIRVTRALWPIHIRAADDGCPALITLRHIISRAIRTFGSIMAYLPAGGADLRPGTGPAVLSTLHGQTFGS
jgi:hypothetical protein